MTTFSRAQHIHESRQLLWEIVTSEPTILQCQQTIESMCLSQGIFCKIDDELCSDEFQKFLNDHYIPFIRESVKHMFTYGFVPFYLATVQKNLVPKILPHGTFTWSIETTPQQPVQLQQDTPGLLFYKVQITCPLLISDSDVHIFPFMEPVLFQSVLYATVPSPLSHLLVDYKNLRQAQIRRSHADAWNTNAKLMCTYKPSQRVQEDPNASLMDFVEDTSALNGLPFMPSIVAANFWTRDTQIQRQFDRHSAHVPDVYTLPRDHDIAQQHMLTPCEDIEFLLNKFQRDVASVFGIPHNMLSLVSVSQETVRKTTSSNRLFTAQMVKICSFCCRLLEHVYFHVYKKRNVEFIMLPLPKMEIESIQDLKVLHEIGAITPDVSLQLSAILLGDELSKKQQTNQLSAQQLPLMEQIKKELGSGPAWKQRPSQTQQEPPETTNEAIKSKALTKKV